MKKRYYLLPILLVLCALNCVLSQSVSIQKIRYEDVKTMDSLNAVTQILSEELRKALPVSYAIEQNGKGSIKLLLRSTADELRIVYPSALKGYNPEGYYIKADTDGLVITGNSILALQHAVFTYLEQLGFRYFLPGDAWYIVPKIKSPFVHFEKLTQPLYEYRYFANGHGYFKNKKVENDFNFWAKANQLGGSFPIRVGHAYQTIVSDNADVFKQHPEYFAEKTIKGTLPPPWAKFNVANKQLVELVLQDAKRRLAIYKKTGQFMNMISMEPSDGSGYCTLPECLEIGSVSDQAFYLTNAVAKGIQKDYPGVWVGTLAYNEHIAPTKFDLEENIFVMVTNGFNRTNHSTNDLLKMWSKKAKKTGVYEYLSVYAWDHDLPGRSNATNLDYLKTSIKDYYENGARAYLGETTIGWVSKGLGQYVASKLLWDYRLNVDSLVNEFYSKCFGDASLYIKELFQSWEDFPNKFIDDHALANWLTLVKKADHSVNDNEIRKRLDYIKVYLHYLVLYKQFKANPVVDNLNRVMNFAYRTIDISAFATVPIIIGLPHYSGLKGHGVYDKGEHAWMKPATPLYAKEIKGIFQNDVQSIKGVEDLRSFEHGKEFNRYREVKPSSRAHPVNMTPSFSGETNFLIRIDERSKKNFFDIKSGYAARPKDAKPVTIKIYKYTQYLKLKEKADVELKVTESEKLENRTINLYQLEPGDYLVNINDYYKLFSIKFSPSMTFSVILDKEKMLQTSSVTGLNSFFFFVAPGTKRFILHKSKILKLQSPAGRLLTYYDNNQQTIVVEVKQNETGLWQIFGQAGDLYIEGIPPYLGLNASKMLLPTYIRNE